MQTINDLLALLDDVRVIVETWLRGVWIFIGEYLARPAWWAMTAVAVAIAVGVPWGISRLIARSDRRQAADTTR